MCEHKMKLSNKILKTKKSFVNRYIFYNVHVSFNSNLYTKQTFYQWFNYYLNDHIFAVASYMAHNFLFCNNLLVHGLANIFLLHIFINLKNMQHDPNVKCFIQIGTVIFHKALVTLYVPLNVIDKTRYSTWIYHYVTTLLNYKTPKSFLCESILSYKTKACTLLYYIINRTRLEVLNDSLFFHGLVF